MNCLAIEQGDDVLVVDCGVTFPSSDLGIDLYHPRFDWLLERKHKLRGIVVTHGHEDHIGGVPYLLDHVDIPVFGPRYALTLLADRLAEHGFADEEVELVATQPRRPYRVASFDVEPIRVTHSTADSTALAIRTRAGTVIHTGDFKLDSDPLDGERTDEDRFGALGREGVRLLLSDSTNVDSDGTSTSESVVAARLVELVEAAPARVVVGMFASNVGRLGAVLEAARRTGRKVALAGRSMTTHTRAGERTGLLGDTSDVVVSHEEAMKLPRERVLLVATGTQAEPRAALPRLANGTHPTLKLDEGDRVVFSSRTIPGNDVGVVQLTNALLRRGIDLVTRESDGRVHASGHAHRGEQRRMIELTQPRALVPLHGTLRHLHRHAALGRDVGVPEVLVAGNGDVVELGPWAAPARVASAVVGRVATAFGEELGDEVLREREQLARGGVLALAIALDGEGRLAAPVRVLDRGAVEADDRKALREAERAAARAVEQLALRERRQDDLVREATRLAARRSIERDTGRRPMVLAVVTRVERGR